MPLEAKCLGRSSPNRAETPDPPSDIGGPLNLNKDPRNGLPYFNTAAFTENALGTPGNASRRSFYGPGGVNFDVLLTKSIRPQ
jgi:hypothetical protein